MKLGTRASRAPKVAHSTDTSQDLNGVALTPRKVAALSRQHHKVDTFIACHSGEKAVGEEAFAPPNVYFVA